MRQAMPPLYDVRLKLEKAASEWASVVGPILGQQSAPLDLADGELLVTAETPLVGNRLSMMGGNIARALAKRWGLEVVKVRVVIGRIPLKATASGGASAPLANLRVREEDVREFESRCLENIPDFPEDAAESLARLRAFFKKRFGK